MGAVELPVVVGVDGSDAASDALDWAAEMAARRRLPLRIVHASLWERYEGYVPATAADRPTERLYSETVLATAAERAGRRAPALKVMTDLAAEDAVTALLRAGQSAEAVVVGSRGRGEFASLLLGSVGLGIAARASCPVIVVRGRPEGVRGRMNRVAVGIAERERPGEHDQTPPSPAVAFALREARLRGCELAAVHAWRCAGPEDHGPHEDHAGHAAELLDEALGGVTEMARPPVPVAYRAVEGPARKALLEASDLADLLVVGARRRQGHFGMQLGLVNHAVLHHARCPVAVVPQP
ncbi:universal stress protein [Streptomyces sp. NBRC 110028]|uniref:universal stress protein n=1 Tax=Streptomyces sp. NBRC 110028 TaxID=1621260 RepID=UPI00099F1BF8|nr:universal stress protein [Streptomyces sp. NBRC 110028]